MLFPPLYIVAYLIFSMMLAFPLSLVLGGYLLWRTRSKTKGLPTQVLLDDGYIPAKTGPGRSTPVLALISFVKAYGISVVVVFGVILIWAFVAIVTYSLQV